MKVKAVKAVNAINASKVSKANRWFMVRHGYVNVKFDREQLSRLPLLNDIFQECKNNTRLLNLGMGNISSMENVINVPDLAIAKEWAATPPNEYVIPSNCHEYERVQNSLRFYGVEEKIVASLRTTAGLHMEVANKDNIIATRDARIAVLENGLREAINLITRYMHQFPANGDFVIAPAPAPAQLAHANDDVVANDP